jgi:hypothetical protein
VAETPAARGLVDTSVVIELDRLSPDVLPSEMAIAAVTLAELAAGPHAAHDPTDRARRQERLQRAEATFDPSRSIPPPRAPTGDCTPRSPRAAAGRVASTRSTCS